MINMIGQQRLLSVLNSYNETSLPKTLLLVGEHGCGKTTAIKNLAERLNFEYHLISSDELTAEDSDKIFYPSTLTIFELVLDDFDFKVQNKLLKFIEEPSNFAYIVLTSISEMKVIPTIQSRCIKLFFDDYTEDELKQINWSFNDLNSLTFKFCKTPGKLLSIDSDSIESLYNLCENIVSRVTTTPYANFLKIVTKINFKEDYNKYDFDLFFDVLKYVATQHYINENDLTAFKVYKCVVDFHSKYIEANRPTKEYFMINMLTNLWEEVN